MSEMRPEERAAIQNDVRRSRPIFTAAPWAREEVNHDAHNARLERVLCAWTQYDQEIGYVQAMNLVSSTLLLLLDGDEEASFWLLVQLIRQLPRSFWDPLQVDARSARRACRPCSWMYASCIRRWLSSFAAVADP